jgi:hypothetical protein
MKDAIGQEIFPGQVCVHAFRVSSSMYFEPILVAELIDEKFVSGTKYFFDWRADKRCWETRKSKHILGERLIVTGLTPETLPAILSMCPALVG